MALSLEELFPGKKFPKRSAVAREAASRQNDLNLNAALGRPEQAPLLDYQAELLRQAGPESLIGTVEMAADVGDMLVQNPVRHAGAIYEDVTRPGGSLGGAAMAQIKRQFLDESEDDRRREGVYESLRENVTGRREFGPQSDAREAGLTAARFLGEGLMTGGRSLPRSSASALGQAAGGGAASYMARDADASETQRLVAELTGIAAGGFTRPGDVARVMNLLKTAPERLYGVAANAESRQRANAMRLVKRTLEQHMGPDSYERLITGIREGARGTADQIAGGEGGRVLRGLREAVSDTQQKREAKLRAAGVSEGVRDDLLSTVQGDPTLATAGTEARIAAERGAAVGERTSALSGAQAAYRRQRDPAQVRRDEAARELEVARGNQDWVRDAPDVQEEFSALASAAATTDATRKNNAYFAVRDLAREENVQIDPRPVWNEVQRFLANEDPVTIERMRKKHADAFKLIDQFEPETDELGMPVTMSYDRLKALMDGIKEGTSPALGEKPMAALDRIIPRMGEAFNDIVRNDPTLANAAENARRLNVDFMDTHTKGQLPKVYKKRDQGLDTASLNSADLRGDAGGRAFDMLAASGGGDQVGEFLLARFRKAFTVPGEAGFNLKRAQKWADEYGPAIEAAGLGADIQSVLEAGGAMKNTVLANAARATRAKAVLKGRTSRAKKAEVRTQRDITQAPGASFTGDQGTEQAAAILADPKFRNVAARQVMADARAAGPEQVENVQASFTQAMVEGFGDRKMTRDVAEDYMASRREALTEVFGADGVADIEERLEPLRRLAEVENPAQVELARAGLPPVVALPLTAASLFATASMSNSLMLQAGVGKAVKNWLTQIPQQRYQAMLGDWLLHPENYADEFDQLDVLREVADSDDEVISIWRRMLESPAGERVTAGQPAVGTAAVEINREDR